MHTNTRNHARDNVKKIYMNNVETVWPDETLQNISLSKKCVLQAYQRCLYIKTIPFTLGHTYHSLVRDECVDDRYQVPGQHQAEQS